MWTKALRVAKDFSGHPMVDKRVWAALTVLALGEGCLL